MVDFLEYPIVTSTNVSYKAKVDFPAVTICNLNRINCHNAFQVVVWFLQKCVNDMMKSNGLNVLPLDIHREHSLS